MIMLESICVCESLGRECSDENRDQRLFVLLHSSTFRKWDKYWTSEFQSVAAIDCLVHRRSWSVRARVDSLQACCITCRWLCAVCALQSEQLQFCSSQQALTDISSPRAAFPSSVSCCRISLHTPRRHFICDSKQQQPLWSAHSGSHYKL